MSSHGGGKREIQKRHYGRTAYGAMRVQVDRGFGKDCARSIVHERMRTQAEVIDHRRANSKEGAILQVHRAASP